MLHGLLTLLELTCTPRKVDGVARIPVSPGIDLLISNMEFNDDDGEKE